MTQEEKQLLLQDLCARLPYEVQCEIGGLQYGPYTFTSNDVEDLMEGRVFKPYLRSMSSMTEDERNEYFDFRNQELQRVALAEVGRESAIAEISDWLNKKMFDYRGLIPKGLAIEATEGMYNK